MAAAPLPAGESEADHRELVDFCRSFRFERMGCFQYSPEDGTPAAELPDQVRLLHWPCIDMDGHASAGCVCVGGG